MTAASLRTAARVAWSPMAISVAFLLFRITAYAGPATAAIRPLIVVVSVALLITVATYAVIRSETRATLVAALITLVGLEPKAAVIALVVAVAWLLGFVVTRVMRRPPLPIERFVAAVRFAATVLLALAIAGVWSAGTIELPVGARAPVPVDATAFRPNITILLLDGYARADTLADSFGLDEGPFLQDLRELGFDVYPDSTSNYNATLLTLVSMLHGDYVEDLGLDRLGGVNDTRQLRRELASAPILHLLRNQGYAITTITPAMAHVTLPGANASVSSGNLTDLEVSLLASSGVGRLLIAVAPDLVLDQQRATVLHGFDALPRTAASGSPQFLLAHLMVPHVPFLFDRKGVSLPLPDCFPDRCFLWEGSPDAVDEDQPDYAVRYAEQVEWVNDRTVRALRELIEADPDAIVVVMGDHGSRLLSDDPGEQFRNLFAARTPGHAGLFGASPTLINVLPSLLDAYLGLQLPERPDRHYLVRDLQELLETEPWP